MKRTLLFVFVLLAISFTLGACSVRADTSSSGPSASGSAELPGEAAALPDGYEEGEPVPPISIILPVPVPESSGVDPAGSALPVRNMPFASGSVPDMITSTATTAFGLDLTIPAVFYVTRPTDKITTELPTYFITGTSDPSEPVYCDSEPIERTGNKGTWGVLVDLDIGNNSFALRQGDKVVTVTITRKGKSATAPISAIRQSSMYPAIQGGVKLGGSLPLECVAPSGSTVVATFGGKSVTLQQSSTAERGIPATFRGELAVDGDYPSGVTTKAGKVTYQLDYDGQKTSCESTGDVFIAGEGSFIAVRVTAYLGLVYPDPSNVSVFREKLKAGAVDYVYSENNTHYRLYSGGYIPKDHCEIIEGEVKIGNAVGKVTPFYAEKREVYTFSGISRPAYHTQYKDNVFYLTLYNTNGIRTVDAGRSRLFSSIDGSSGENSSVTYAFRVKSPNLYWGHQIWYDGTDLVIRFQYKPSLSGNSGRPFDGITIMLDPGHGDHDPGAPGVAAFKGPDEALLNLINAFAVRDKLTTLGAEVIMTRSGVNEFLTLDERLQAFEVSGADLFLSLHHNSVGEDTDGNIASGTEIYYHTWTSASSAKAIVDGYTSLSGHKNRGAKQSYYRVTIHPQAPSMLIELGFVSNPAEYELMCLPAQIDKQANGMVEGLKRVFS